MQGDFSERPHSTPKERRGQGSGRNRVDPDGMSPSLSLDDTGESTRSLLSVLSHSSLQDHGEDGEEEVLADESRDKLSFSSSGSSSTRRSETPRSFSSRSSSKSSRSGSHTESGTASSRSSHRKVARSSSTTTSQTTSSSSPPLTPWEKWLIEKTKQDRQKAKIKMKQEKEKQVKEEEEKKVKAAKATVVSTKVNMWIEEKTVQEAESRRAGLRVERTKRRMEEEEKRRIADKAKENYQEWAEKKKAESEALNERQQAEEREKEEDRRRRKEEARAAYQQWRGELAKRPQTPSSPYGYQQGTGKGYNIGGYPAPSFYNPVPWMPIHVPQESSQKAAVGGKRGHGKKNKGHSSSSSLRQIQQPLSPPLLFKERSAREKGKMHSHSRPR